MFRTLRRSCSNFFLGISSKSLWETFLWVGYNFLGGLMPIWGTFILLKLYHRQFALNDFVTHGEFALYTAAFLAPALQVVVRNIKGAKYDLGTGAVLLALAGLVLSATIYSGVVVASASTPTVSMQSVRPKTEVPETTGALGGGNNPIPAPAGPIDVNFLRWSSLSLFAVSMLFAAGVEYKNNRLLQPDPTASEHTEQAVLENRVDDQRPEAIQIAEIAPAPEATNIESDEDLAAKFKPEQARNVSSAGGLPHAAE